MIRYFAAHPTAANLLMVLFLAIGIATLPDLKRETFPEVKTHQIDITVKYPGATPLDVEQEICRPLEDALDGISFTEEKVCQAKQNLGIMSIKMVEKGTFQQFFEDVQAAVDGISDFPEQAEKAVVNETGRTQNVASIALTADIPRTELKTLAEQLKQRLLLDPGIPLVEISGFPQRQLRVEITNYAMRRYGLSLQQLADVISKQDINLPLGTIETRFQDVQLRFDDERQSANELGSLVILKGSAGNEVTLADVATVIETFERAEEKIEFNGHPAALLTVRKNSIDDSLNVLDAIEAAIAREQSALPDGVKLTITQDATSIVKDRIRLLVTNAWQGLLLVFAVMWLFFTIRYAFWVVMGLPVSFLAAFFVLGHMGITINMISMVALLLALGILMDDAIVIAESIGTEVKNGKSPLQAAMDGTSTVATGVFSSFLTTLCIFFGLVFIEGDLGQILKVIPIVLICVICVSLIEAFLILPSHLYHSLSHARHHQAPSQFRAAFDRAFERLRQHIHQLADYLIGFRYAFVGGVIALFAISVSMLTSGILKFSAFPAIEGDLVQARILMPAGTPLSRTEAVVQEVLQALSATEAEFSPAEATDLVKAVTVSYSQNTDAMETGPHLATVMVDLLTAEQRAVRMQDFINRWRETVGVIADAQTISFKEPAIGPSGRAIEIRLYGDDLTTLSHASQDLQRWLSGYPGVNNLLDDLRPGKPEYTLRIKPGAYDLGLDANAIAGQLRAAFQGITVKQSHRDLESLDVTVMLAQTSRNEFIDFDTFPIVHPRSGVLIPLSTVVDIIPTRGYSRIGRVNNQRTVTVYGDVDTLVNNTKQVLSDVQARWLPLFQQRYPELNISFEGEIKNGAITQRSIGRSMILGIIGVFLLLSFQFRSYKEPIIILITIPLALIGVIWGHLLMGINFTMPSMLGFVSLAGIVVNDSILLVEFVKRRAREGGTVHDAAARASYDRFRAVLLTSVTTIAGMTPLLFETSLQAQVLIPLATSIVFGIATSTLLVLFVVPCLYAILEDFGLTNIDTDTSLTPERSA